MHIACIMYIYMMEFYRSNREENESITSNNKSSKKIVYDLTKVHTHCGFFTDSEKSCQKKIIIKN